MLGCEYRHDASVYVHGMLHSSKLAARSLLEGQPGSSLLLTLREPPLAIENGGFGVSVIVLTAV